MRHFSLTHWCFNDDFGLIAIFFLGTTLADCHRRDKVECLLCAKSQTPVRTCTFLSVGVFEIVEFVHAIRPPNRWRCWFDQQSNDSCERILFGKCLAKVQINQLEIGHRVKGSYYQEQDTCAWFSVWGICKTGPLQEPTNGRLVFLDECWSAWTHG